MIKADLIELIGKAKDLWHKREGLYLVWGISSIPYWAAILLLYKILYSDLKVWESTKGSLIYYLITLVIFIAGLGFIWLKWKNARATPQMPCEKPSILFAIDGDADSKDQVKRLYDGFHKELKKRGLEGTVHYSILPRNQEIHNQEQAREYLSQSGATIVIFGEYHTGSHKTLKTQQFQRLSFHWSGNTPIDQRDQAMLVAMEEFPFKVEESESLSQIPKAQYGFANVVLFFVSLSLTSIGQTEQARPLWRDLLDKESNNPKARNRSPLYRKWWARNEFAHARYLYIKDVEQNLTNPEFHSSGKTILTILQQTEDQLRSYAGYYMLKAICEFHLGDARQARITTERGLKKFRKNDGLVCSFNLSLGFLATWRKLYDRSIRHYRSTITSHHKAEDIDHILRFIRTVSRNNPHRKDLHFCTCFVTDHHTQQNSRVIYEEFLDQTAGIMEIELLREYVDSRIDKLHKQRD